ncbi:MAG: DUF177 domain-containing protein [Sphingomonadales bacterium]
MTPEFSRRYALDSIGSAPRDVSIEATESERAALARRFDLVSLGSLKATAVLHTVASGVEARGAIRATVIQSCVVGGDPVAATINEPFALRFLIDAPVAGGDDEEGMELSDTDCDILPLEDGAVDLGEAAAQTLGLALDPFPRSPESRADEERVWKAGEERGAFAGLKGLLGG